MSIPLLHNMSAAPRTQVSCVQRPVHGAQVFFSIFSFLNAAGERLPTALKRRIRDVGLHGLDEAELRRGLSYVAPSACLDPTQGDTPPLQGVMVGWGLMAEIDRQDLTGDRTRFALANRIQCCADLSLVVQVLARCESHLYLGHREPSGSLTQLARRPVTFDDPRLAALPSLQPAVWSWPHDAQEAAIIREAPALRRSVRRAHKRENQSSQQMPRPSAAL